MQHYYSQAESPAGVALVYPGSGSWQVCTWHPGWGSGLWVGVLHFGEAYQPYGKTFPLPLPVAGFWGRAGGCC